MNTRAEPDKVSLPEFRVEAAPSSPGKTREKRSTPAALRGERKAEMLQAELEVPFDPAFIQWRAMQTRYKNGGGGRLGFCLPYADRRSYEDRLNRLFKAKGWTNDLGKVETTLTKVIVTCRLTLDVLGTKSATGEEWLKSGNAATSAEAQAFKRACACFGLGRYLYSFTGTWLELDEDMRALDIPILPVWATPDGWRQGHRPDPAGPKPVADPPTSTFQKPQPVADFRRNTSQSGHNFKNVVIGIREMEHAIGTRLYRSLLKSIANTWQPEDIRAIGVQHKVLAIMKSASRGLDRLRSASVKLDGTIVQQILGSAELQSINDISDMNTLQRVVLGLEQAAAAQAITALHPDN